ncbi:MAG: hypothetical protein ACE5G1_04960, partial [bacterium]
QTQLPNTQVLINGIQGIKSLKRLYVAAYPTEVSKSHVFFSFTFPLVTEIYFAYPNDYLR